MATKVAKLPAQAGTVHWLNECIERGKREVFSTPAALTPGLAAELLRRNPRNRPLGQSKLQQYIADIRADRWTLNGEALIFSVDGAMNGGQHRCNAVVEANRAIETLFTFGVTRESRLTLDQGKGQTAGDYLAMQGLPNATVQASVSRQVIAYERAEGEHLNAAAYISNREINERAINDPGIGNSAHFAVGHRKGCRLFAAPSIIGFCHYILFTISEEDADEYLRQVCDGEGLKRRDPAYSVRDRLLTMGKAGLQPKAHVIFRGWNAYRQGRPLAIVKIIDGGLPALV